MLPGFGSSSSSSSSSSSLAPAPGMGMMQLEKKAMQQQQEETNGKLTIDILDRYERLQRQAAVVKRMKKVLDARIKELTPKLREYCHEQNAKDIATPGHGQIKIVRKEPPVSSITFKQMQLALKSNLPDDDANKVVEYCRKFVNDQKEKNANKNPDGLGYMRLEYLLKHPNVEHRTIQMKDIAFPQQTEEKLLGMCAHEIDTTPLQVVKPEKRKAPPRKKKESKSSSSNNKKKKNTLLEEIDEGGEEEEEDYADEAEQDAEVLPDASTSTSSMGRKKVKN